MNKILQRIANTIVANLANTEPAGLFDGKMGLCLFLYRYARYSGHETYEDIASILLDDVFSQLKPNMSPSAMDGVASIGFGLVKLFREDFSESDADDNVLKNIDDILLRNIRTASTKEVQFPIPLYSSGIYLLSRISFHKDEMESEWVTSVIQHAIWLIADCDKKPQKAPVLSLLNSMFYAFSRLLSILETDRNKIKHLLTDILRLSVLSIQQNNYNEIDVILFQQNIKNLPSEFKIEILPITNTLKEVCSFAFEETNMDMLYDNLWWWLLYDLWPKEDFSLDVIENYIDEKLKDSYYDEMAVNSKLAAVGIWIMSQNKI